MDWFQWRREQLWFKTGGKSINYIQELEKINMEELVSKLKELRKQADGLNKLTKSLNSAEQPRGFGEIYCAASALDFSKAWMGKWLEAIGTDNPYKEADGKRKEIKDIIPTADVMSSEELNVIMEEWHMSSRNHIGRIDAMRQVIAEFIKELEKLDDIVLSSRKAAVCRTQAWTYAVEARMYLGFSLSAIRG